MTKLIYQSSYYNDKEQSNLREDVQHEGASKSIQTKQKKHPQKQRHSKGQGKMHTPIKQGECFSHNRVGNDTNRQRRRRHLDEIYTLLQDIEIYKDR
jgi:hypothetical protein